MSRNDMDLKVDLLTQLINVTCSMIALEDDLQKDNYIIL